MSAKGGSWSGNDAGHGIVIMPFSWDSLRAGSRRCGAEQCQPEQVRNGGPDQAVLPDGPLVSRSIARTGPSVR